jgi:curved DNA-binding protein CbpA
MEQEKQTDFYQILGLEQDATKEEIYEKYLKMSLIYHPDKGGDAEKYRQVNLAYNVLKNPENRQKYNDALATTHDQLKRAERETSYRNFEINPEFTTDGKFDNTKFMEHFVKEHKGDPIDNKYGVASTSVPISAVPVSQKEEEKDIKEDVNKLLNDRLAARDMEFLDFKSKNKTNLGKDVDQFNFVFNQYKSRYSSNEVKEIVEPITMNDLMGHDDMYMESNLINDIISELPVDYQSTTEKPIEQEELENKVKAFQSEREDMLKNCEYTVNFDDTNKPIFDL